MSPHLPTTGPRRRILFLSHSAGGAGAELALAESAQALAGAGHQVFATFPEQGGLIDRMTPALSGHIVTPYDHWATAGHWPLRTRVAMLAGYLRSARQIARQARAWGVDLIVTNTTVTPVGGLAAWMAGIPHWWYLHEFVTEDHGLRFPFGERASYAMIARLSDRLLVNSHTLDVKLTRMTPGVTRSLLYYAVDHLPWPKTPSDAALTSLLLAGRLSEGKGQLLALEALAMVRQRYPGVHLTLLGAADPTFLPKIESRIAELGLQQHVTRLDHQPDVLGALRGHGVLLMCSRAEAFGRVVVEGQKAGCLVIASDLGAGPELIEHGKTGRLYRGDSAADLAQEILASLADEGASRQIARAGQLAAHERFSGLAHVAGWERLLTTLPARKPTKQYV